MKKRIAVLGGGLAGCAAALMAKRAGMEPVIIERRSYLGFEINGRYQIFMDEKSWDTYVSEGSLDLKGETVGHEICFFQGETKAGLMKQIYEAQIPCLLLTQTAAVICDERECVTGLLLANNYGEYYMQADAVMDCTGDGVLSAIMAGVRHDTYSHNGDTIKASFSMELECPAWNEDVLELTGDFLWNGKVWLHGSKRGTDTRIAVFETEIPMREDIPAAYVRSYVEHVVKAEAVSVIAGIRSSITSSAVYLINMASETALEPTKTGNFRKIDGLYENPYSLPFLFNPDSLLMMERNMRCLIRKISLSNEGQKSSEKSIYINGKKYSLEEALKWLKKPKLEIMKADLAPVQLKPEILDTYSTGAAVAGLGTAGMASLYGLGANAPYTGIESQYLLGGTRTTCHVINYYYGRQGGFTKKLNKAFRNFDCNILKTPEAGREKFGYINLALMHHYHAVENEQLLFIGSTVCDVVKKGNTVTGLVFANESGIFALRMSVCLDMTGNGDAAVLAGAEFKFGADEDGICQTYSQWGVEERVHENFHYRSTVGDYDMVDTTEYGDMLRASMAAQMKNSRYYSSNPVGYREGRRIIGRDYIDIKRAIRNDPLKEPFAVAVSTIDNHGKTTADFSRMGFCAVARDYKVTLPLDCFIPRHLEAILVGGKAISVDKDTLAIVRMNADVQNAGYALGYVARLMAQNGGKTVPYSEIEEFLQREDLIPAEYVDRAFPDAQEAVNALTEKAPYSLLNVILQRKEEVVPLLLKEYGNFCQDLNNQEENQSNDQKSRQLLLAKALAWFGHAAGRDLIIERINWLKDHEKTDPACDIAERSDTVRHGIDGELNEYWEMNQLIETAGRIRDPEITRLLCSLIEKCETGGAPYESRFPYFKVRRDEACIPYYDRIFNLAHVFFSSPDEAAAEALEGLLDKEYVGGGYFAEKITDEPFMMASYLELITASAAFRCGSEKARKTLERYANDVRSIYAKIAVRELQRR